MSFFTKFSIFKKTPKSHEEQPKSKKKGGLFKKRISSEISIPQIQAEIENPLSETSKSWGAEASPSEELDIAVQGSSTFDTNMSLSTSLPEPTIDFNSNLSTGLDKQQILTPSIQGPASTLNRTWTGSVEFSPPAIETGLTVDTKEEHTERSFKPPATVTEAHQGSLQLKRVPLFDQTPTSSTNRTLRYETTMVEGGQHLSSSPKERKRRPTKAQLSPSLFDYESDNSEVNFSVGVVSITRPDPSLTTPKGAYIHGMLGGPKRRPDLEDALYAPSGSLLRRRNKSGSSSFSFDTADMANSAPPKIEGGESSADEGTKSKGAASLVPNQKLMNLTRQLEKERRARELVELQYDKMKQMHQTYEYRVDQLLSQNRKLQEKREELEARLSSLKFEMATHEDKRRSAERTLGRVKELLHKKEEELLRAQEIRQRSEQELQTRDMEFQALSNNVKELEEERDDYSHRLRELLNEYSPMDNNSLLQRSLPNLEFASRVEHSVLTKMRDGSFYLKHTTDSLESINQELLGLKAELDRSRSRYREDRLKLLESNQQLKQRVDALSEQLDLREEALATASLQYTIHVNQLKAEMSGVKNTVARQEEMKKDLENEILSLRESNDELRNQLYTLQEYLASDPEKSKTIPLELFANGKSPINEKELREMRDLNRTMSEKVSSAENKLHALEVELLNANEKLKDKHREMESSQFTVSQLRGKMERWREKAHALEVEREGLYAQVEGLTERLEDFRANNQRLQKHLDGLSQAAMKSSQENHQSLPFITKEMFDIVRQNQKLLDTVTSLLPLSQKRMDKAESDDDVEGDIRDTPKRGRRGRYYNQSIKAGPTNERKHDAAYYNGELRERRPSLEGISGSKNKLASADSPLDPEQRAKILNRLELLEKEAGYSDEKLKSLRRQAMKDRGGNADATRLTRDEIENEQEWNIDSLHYVGPSGIEQERQRSEKQREKMFLKIPAQHSQSFSMMSRGALQHSISSQNIMTDSYLGKPPGFLSPTTPSWGARPNPLQQIPSFQIRQNSSRQFNVRPPGQMDLLQHKLKTELDRSISRHLEAGQVTPPPHRGKATSITTEASSPPSTIFSQSSTTLAGTHNNTNTFPSSFHRESPIGGASSSSTLQFHESEQELMYKASPQSNAAAASYRHSKYLI